MPDALLKVPPSPTFTRSATQIVEQEKSGGSRVDISDLPDDGEEGVPLCFAPSAWPKTTLGQFNNVSRGRRWLGTQSRPGDSIPFATGATADRPAEIVSRAMLITLRRLHSGRTFCLFSSVLVKELLSAAPEASPRTPPSPTFIGAGTTSAIGSSHRTTAEVPSSGGAVPELIERRTGSDLFSREKPGGLRAGVGSLPGHEGGEGVTPVLGERFASSAKVSLLYHLHMDHSRYASRGSPASNAILGMYGGQSSQADRSMEYRARLQFSPTISLQPQQLASISRVSQSIHLSLDKNVWCAPEMVRSPGNGLFALEHARHEDQESDIEIGFVPGLPSQQEDIAGRSQAASNVTFWHYSSPTTDMSTSFGDTTSSAQREFGPTTTSAQYEDPTSPSIPEQRSV
ncbi:hypothetical protein NP233_g10341 [Leucocoprinus birnbaumii]|uniref:Uncharacterized protein n=1 Tax=Leucocoprinus birnbaumii TaxID=56174 RepID=A0AAD5VJ56_9AGAR|nr:hypothetical protein NP233_g10341 [Leucocoprinus birnbaumii]